MLFLNVDDVAVWTELECIIFPSSQRRGGCAIKKMPRSHKSGADGVVSSAGLGRRAELTTPSATNRNGSIVFDVADTPPLRGGECAARKTLSKKLKLTASFHKMQGKRHKSLLFCAFLWSSLCFLWLVPLLLGTAAAPHRIVSVAPAITEILFALGVGDQIVGVTTYCNYPEAAKAKPKIGGYTTPSIEAILALRPDQVMMMEKRPDVAERLRQAGIDVTQVQPESLAGLYDAIRVISEKAGVPDRGRSLIQSIEMQLREVSPKPAGVKPRLLFIVGRTPGTVSDLIAVGKGSYLNEIIEIAGADNIFGAVNLPYPKVGVEEVIRRNPDVIIDMGHNEMVTESQKQAVKQLWKKYPFLRAVQRDAVFPISAEYFVQPGPRVVQAVRDIRKMIGK